MGVDLVFETHSISVDNERGVATGWLDGALSEEGRRLAAKLGERRRDVDVVYVSDLGRAVETAEIAFGATAIPVRVDARLRECNYGELNGMPVERLDVERSQRIDVPYPGGESYRQCVERVRSFLGDVTSECAGKRVLVIGHSATWWALEHLLNGHSLEELVAAPRSWREGWSYTGG
jgi:broad specificity phosphatase PhoE